MVSEFPISRDRSLCVYVSILNFKKSYLHGPRTPFMVDKTLMTMKASLYISLRRSSDEITMFNF